MRDAALLQFGLQRALEGRAVIDALQAFLADEDRFGATRPNGRDRVGFGHTLIWVRDGAMWRRVP
jgi:hypothetical protein